MPVRRRRGIHWARSANRIAMHRDNQGLLASQPRAFAQHSEMFNFGTLGANGLQQNRVSAS